jgi:hypothetical protein
MSYQSLHKGDYLVLFVDGCVGEKDIFAFAHVKLNGKVKVYCKNNKDFSIEFLKPDNYINNPITYGKGYYKGKPETFEITIDKYKNVLILSENHEEFWVKFML